jgi:hypothetical protein
MIQRGQLVFISLLAVVGCAQCDRGAADRPTHVFQWAIGHKDDKEKEKAEAKSSEGEPKPDEGDKSEVNPEAPDEKPKSKRDEPLRTDRPDFLESPATVGRGVVQLESGYSFSGLHDPGARTRGHSYPELLGRVGLFADWFEFRIGQNFSSTSSSGPAGTMELTGAEDLYLGTKLALTEQKKFLPETGLIIQMTVPTGHPELSAGQVLPGVNWVMNWDIIKDRLSLGAGVQINRAIDDFGQVYIEWASAVSASYTLTKRLGAYTEWFAIYPDGAGGAEAGSQHYFDAGLTFRVTNNFQLDARGGVGLNERADHYFFGAGLAFRR